MGPTDAAWALLVAHPRWSTLSAFAVAHVSEHPMHVAIETFLVALIAYVLFAKRAYDPAKR